MRRRLREAVVVITGASSGIGRAAALEFARKGSTVVLAARNEAALKELAGECEALGVTALAVPTDTADQRSVDELAQRAMNTFGRIDVWVNNAAVMLFGRFEDIPADSFRQVMETNFFGYVNGARAALRCFRQQEGGGVLVNNASGYASMGAPYVSPYVASKFAVRGLSDSLRQELMLNGHRRIQVVTVLPAAIDTPLFQHAANFTGRTVMPMKPVYPPERVARTIVSVARRPEREAFVGHSARFGTVLRTLAPALFERLNARQVERTSFSPEPAVPSEGNLRRPLPPEAVTGGWRPATRARVRNLLVASALVGAPAWLGWLGWQRRRIGRVRRLFRWATAG
jgi:short-subunit dehydrogenase